jgi:hypothetical protein
LLLSIAAFHIFSKANKENALAVHGKIVFLLCELEMSCAVVI